MSKLKSGKHKKAMHAAYKSRSLAAKNKERKALRHMAKQPNDKVNITNVDATRNKSHAKKPADFVLQQLVKQDRKLLNLKNHAPKKARYKRPDSAFKVAFRAALEKAGI